MKKTYIIILFFTLVFTACDDFLDPRLSNELTIDQMYKTPGNIANLAFTAYGIFPSTSDLWNGSFLDCATTNAIDANSKASVSKMQEQEGSWTSLSSLTNNWSTCYDYINHINLFLEIGLSDDILYFKSDEVKDGLYKKRLESEVYFLRAYVQFDLLRRFSGVDETGKLMGFPIITEVQNVDDFEQLPRNTFDECVEQIVNDLEKATTIGGLKDEWDPAEAYNEIVGDENIGRPTNIACLALKSRVLLYAASPAYSFGLGASETNAKYAKAAQAAYDVIEKIGSELPDVYSPDNISGEFYNAPQNEELIMRRLDGGSGGSSDGIAVRNFPPATGLLGQGGCNPSQNLVDAFPMANGYPINHSNNMDYSDDSMYVNRDPRFYNTVLYNGAVFKEVPIEVFEGGNCAVGSSNVDANEATRTGYYLRKWLSPTANLVAGNKVGDYHYFPVFRKVEAFLNFAEAANAAFGPKDARLGMSANDALAEVRRRAGIATDGTDGYLEEASASVQLMDELIRNERRIELCFEGHYFFDLRRWKESLNENIEGVNITNNDGEISIERVNVVTPVYEDYMYYGPIPNNEILKTDHITQNLGW